MISSKDPASEPCNKNISYHRHQNEMHKIPALLNSFAESPQRKRKVDQYMNSGKFSTTFEIRAKTHGKQNVVNQSRSQSSHPTTLPVSKGKCVISKETQESVAFPTLNDRTEHTIVCQEDYSHLSDSDDSYEGLYLKKHRNLKSMQKDLMSRYSCTHSYETLIKSSFNEDFVNSVESSHSLCSKNEDKELNPPLKNFLAPKGNYLLRPIIPIGPRFQVDVPKWDVTRNTRNSDEDLKWLGTQISSMPNITQITTRVIGKRRMEFKGGKMD